MISMILKDLLEHFEIEGDFPDFLLNQTFNEVFLDGDLSRDDDRYKLAVTTRQDVTHQMFLNPNDDFPVIILSILPNGLENGMKFSKNNGDVTYINGL